MNGWELVTILVGGIATLAIFSFVVKENAVYRFFEHLFIGIASGFGIIFTFTSFLWPQIIQPLFGLDIVTYPDGTLSHPYEPIVLLYLIPALFGLLYYFILSARSAWLAKLVIGFTLGASGALTFKGFFNEMMPQVFSSFKPLVVLAASGEIDYMKSFSNTVFVVTLLSVMYYFFFSFKMNTEGTSKVSALGRWLMMICFGAFFGSTVMARMALLVERLEFLIHDWSGAVGSLFS